MIKRLTANSKMVNYLCKSQDSSWFGTLLQIWVQSREKPLYVRRKILKPTTVIIDIYEIQVLSITDYSNEAKSKGLMDHGQRDRKKNLLGEELKNKQKKPKRKTETHKCVNFTHASNFKWSDVPHVKLQRLEKTLFNIRVTFYDLIFVLRLLKC